MSCGRRRSNRSDGRWPPRRLLAESSTTTMTTPRDERGRAAEGGVDRSSIEKSVIRQSLLLLYGLQHFYGERSRGATTDREEGGEFVDHVQQKGYAGY
ncbi:hypothetical protein BHE74_00054496 [Ensete ventricosum]|nr:hypothetical protein GW17_00061007 [Ensete ventricosum]RWW40118.1 hypothetical protein BHE74_00054496 [Ensete ventricosum]RZS19062.1 hypothetical protein BHM03_00051389 [Ensete ventricosum]